MGLYGPKSWSKTFYADEFDRSCTVGWDCPNIDTDHKDPETGRAWCFRCGDDLGPLATQGDFHLRSPINIRNTICRGDLNPQNIKLLSLSCMGMHDGCFGVNGRGDAYVVIKGDGAEIHKEPNLRYPKKEWELNLRTPNIPISQYTELGLTLHEYAIVTAFCTWVSIHIAQIKIDCEYYSDEPIQTANVTINVRDSVVLKPISNALVTIKRGPVIVGSAYTDGGTVTIPNIDEGSYTLKVTASGYEPYELSITVTTPAVEYDALIVPIPAPPLPWWAIPAAVGIAALGTVTVVPALLKRPRPPPPVYVVK